MTATELDTSSQPVHGIAVGVLFKRITLLIGAVYLSFVTVTNTVDFVATVGGYHWTFLNSGNAAYIESVTKTYSMPAWFNDTAVLAAAVAECFGAVLFWRAVVRFRGHGTGVREAWWALTWNVVLWLGFISGTEFFVAYTSEGPFRELLMIGLAMAVVIAVVPDVPAVAGPVDAISGTDHPGNGSSRANPRDPVTGRGPR